MTQDRRPRSEQHIAMEAAARAGPETQALLVGVGSRRRSASQAIDLQSNGGVNLGL
jgi:hypothetical protein